MTIYLVLKDEIFFDFNNICIRDTMATSITSCNASNGVLTLIIFFSSFYSLLLLDCSEMVVYENHANKAVLGFLQLLMKLHRESQISYRRIGSKIILILRPIYPPFTRLQHSKNLLDLNHD